LNISPFLNQFPSNLGSDYLYMFKKNSSIYCHFSLHETQWLYYLLLNQVCWIISILPKLSAPLSYYKTKTLLIYTLTGQKKSWSINYPSKISLILSNLKNGLWIFMPTGKNFSIFIGGGDCKYHLPAPSWGIPSFVSIYRSLNRFLLKSHLITWPCSKWTAASNRTFI
jgi:hypothetical protein